MEQNVTCFEKEVSCGTLLSAMVKGKFGSVPIVDGEHRLIGIVSECDLLEGILSGVDLTCLQTGKLMHHPHAVSNKCTAKELGRFLQKNDLIRPDTLRRL